MQIANPPPSGITASAPASTQHFLSTAEGELALVVIALGALVMIGLTFILKAKTASADDAVRAYALIMIITGTMVLICAGYSNDQIAPAMGLFGTVAGYLLGRKGSQP